MQAVLRAARSRGTLQVAARCAPAFGGVHLSLREASAPLNGDIRFMSSRGEPKRTQRCMSSQDAHTKSVDAMDGNADEERAMFPSRNITQDFTHQQYTSTRYEYDYDADNLHMSPQAVTSQDSEHLLELEMIRHEDVGEDVCSYYGEDDEHHETFSAEDDEYEFEEDWEIMRAINCEGGSGPCDVLDNVDDVNDVVI